MSFSFSVDYNDFLKNVGLFLSNSEKASKKALTHTGFRIVYDTVFEVPKPPLKWGNLRGSFSVIVGDSKPITDIPTINKEKRTPIKKNKKGKSIPEKEPDIDMQEPDKDGIERLELRVGFNVPYAKKMHERLEPEGDLKIRFPDPSERGKIGGKFLEKKLRKNEQFYYKILENELSKEIAKL